MATKTLHVRIEESLYEEFQILFPHYGQKSQAVTTFIRRLVAAKKNQAQKFDMSDPIDAASIKAMSDILEEEKGGES